MGTPSESVSRGQAWLTPTRVQSVRAIVALGVRLVGTSLVAFGVYLVLARVVYAILVSGNFWQNLQVFWGIAQDHGVVRGIPMIVVGTALALSARVIALWAVAVPESGCPHCRYAGSAEGGVCPECGLAGVEPAADTPTA